MKGDIPPGQDVRSLLLVLQQRENSFVYFDGRIFLRKGNRLCCPIPSTPQKHSPSHLSFFSPPLLALVAGREVPISPFSTVAACLKGGIFTAPRASSSHPGSDKGKSRLGGIDMTDVGKRKSALTNEKDIALPRAKHPTVQRLL